MKNALDEKRAQTIIRKPVRIEAADEIELLPMMKNRTGTRMPRHETQKLSLTRLTKRMAMETPMEKKKVRHHHQKDDGARAWMWCWDGGDLLLISVCGMVYAVESDVLN
jgi:hypothetical protein